MGAHLDLAAEQTAFIMNEGLEAPSMLVSRTVYAQLITKSEGKALCLVLWFFDATDSKRLECSRTSTSSRVDIVWPLL